MATALLVAVVTAAACGRQPPSPPAPSAAPKINPADIEAVRSALPADYEIGDLDGPVSAASLWGFGTGWTADPPQCAALADPAPTDPIVVTDPGSTHPPLGSSFADGLLAAAVTALRVH
jgi:hypothetical protein